MLQKFVSLCKDNKKDEIEKIIELFETEKMKCDDFISEIDKDGNNCLFWLIINKNKSYAKRLLKLLSLIDDSQTQMSIITIKNIYKQTILMWCAKYGFNDIIIIILNMILNHQSKEESKEESKEINKSGIYKEYIDSKDYEGGTAILWAIYFRNSETVKLLIEKGVDVKAKDNNNITPLMIAARDGLTYCVDLLIKSGSEVNIRDCYGKDALYYATYNRHGNIISLIRKYKK